MKTFTLTTPSSTPRFKEKLHVGRPNVGDVETYITQVRNILETRYLTAEATNVNEGTMTSEFGENSEHRNRISIAIVQFVQQMTCLAPMTFFNSFSKRFTYGPLLTEQDTRVAS